MKLILLALSFIFSSFASDHIDGVPSLKHPQSDLTDLYAFKSSGDPNRLVLILNIYPGADEKSHFSSKINYEISVSSVSLNKAPKDPGFSSNGEVLNIDCSFTDAHSVEGQKAQCNFSGKGVISFIAPEMNKVFESDPKGIYFFAGHRADPFFISYKHFNSVTGREDFPTPINQNPLILLPTSGNLMEGFNILSLVMEIDVEMFNIFEGTDSSLLGISATSYYLDGKNKKILDHVGRPEITNLSLHNFESDPLKVEYNLRKESLLSQDAPLFQKVVKRLTDNINAYDQLDLRTHWKPADLNNLTKILAEDQLIYDFSKPDFASKNSFFEIETALLKGETHTSSGGRNLSDDIMNTLYALYIGGLDSYLPDFRTGADTPYMSSDKSLSSRFPYLAEPWTPQWFVRKKLLGAAKKRQEGKGQ